MRPKIAYQGEAGSNSQEACAEHFPEMEAVPYPTFPAALSSVKSGVCELAMIPMENSIAGRVADVHRLLPGSGLKIVGETFKRIRFDLMANPGVAIGDLRKVLSHPMALAQCGRLIQDYGLEPVAVGDTAGAARQLAQSPDLTAGALAPPSAAALYGLATLRKDVEDDHRNTTRFLILRGDHLEAFEERASVCLTAFVFRVRNVPAALYRVLGGFATNGVNLIKLESYSSIETFSSTTFYAEAVGRPSDVAFEHALQDLLYFSDRFEVLGVFRADPCRRLDAS